jgi:hypothetical protein
MTGSDDAMDRELALALAAEAPLPRAGFREELRERVEAGFPRERRIKLPARRKLMPALAVATCAVVALTVVGVTRDGEEGSPATLESTSRQGGGAAAEQTPSTAAPAPPADQSFTPGRTRRIERSARLTLGAPPDRLGEVGQRITTITERHKGFVLNSSLATGEDSDGGTYELRVPAADLRGALADLSRLGSVRSQSQEGQDVTAGYVSASDRLEATRAERRSLLRRLERAGTDTQAEALRRQLDLNAQQVSGLRSQLRELRVRTDYAAVTVTLESGKDDGAAAGGSDGLGGAVDDALGSLSASVELLVRAMGVGIPIALLALLAWLGARAARRWRREAALC